MQLACILLPAKSTLFSGRLARLFATRSGARSNCRDCVFKDHNILTIVIKHYRKPVKAFDFSREFVPVHQVNGDRLTFFPQ